jgi:hypothetical protein
MAEIIDLDLLVTEAVSFKIGGKVYDIPTSLNTEIVIRLMKLEQKIKDVEDFEEALKFQDELVYLLFSQLNEDVTIEWVAGLAQNQKSAVIQNYKNRMNEINSDPNSKSLPSQK